MNYMQILGRALSISWRHRYMWLLALFAGEATTVGMSFQSSSGRRGNHRDWSAQDWTHFTAWVGDHSALLLSAAITLALIGLVLFVVSAVANGALVRAGAEHDAERPFGLRQAWSAGVRTFRPVLGLKLFALVVYASAAVIIGGLVLMTVFFGTIGAYVAAVATGVLAAVLLLAAIPAGLVFGVAIVLGVRAVVLDGRRASEGLRSGLGLIRRRLGRVALFWLLVCIAGAVAQIAVWLAVLVAAVPVVALTAAAYFAAGWPFAIAMGVGLGAAWLVVVATFVGGVNAFTSTCWTVAYPRFDLEPQPATSAQPQPA